MEVSQTALAWMLTCSALCGVCFGFVYDVLRWIRPWSPRVTSVSAQTLAHRLALPPRLRSRRESRQVRPKRPRLVQAILYGVLMLEDILYCLGCAVALTLILYATNDGQMRISAIALFGVGWAVYTLTLGLIVRRVSCYLFVLLRATAVWCVALTLAPVRLLARLMWRWTTPLRRHIFAIFTRCRQRLRMAIAKRKQYHNKEKPLEQGMPPAPKPQNSKHYFSTRGGGIHPTA